MHVHAIYFRMLLIKKCKCVTYVRDCHLCIVARSASPT